jgi:metal-sulfur cluster biosynthetic enzyme
LSDPVRRGGGGEAGGERPGGAAGEPLEERVRDALREVIDPEVGIDVVELGLVYTIDVRDGDAYVTLTMTSPACPLGEYITSSAEAAIRRAVPALRSLRVELVRDPPWRPEMMSEAARRQLGWRG